MRATVCFAVLAFLCAFVGAAPPAANEGLQLRAPAPQPSKRAPLPQPSKRAPQPQVSKRAPAPQVSKRAPAPQPSKRAPQVLKRAPQASKRAPAPQVSKRAPQPQVSKRAPAPQVSKRAPEPQVSKRAPAPQPSKRTPQPIAEKRAPAPEPVPSSARRMKRDHEQLPLAALSAELCPASLSSCPIGNDGFECVDFHTDLRSCGGCGAADPFMYDCSSIANADSVACAAGRCLVMSCMPGYTVAASRDACVPSWA